MFGRFAYSIRRRFGHGLKAAWFRDVVRPRILKSMPIEADDRSHCEIHVLTSATDWLNLLWALKSFYLVADRRYALCIHDDGTLDESIRNQLVHHFPLARILGHEESKKQVLASLCGKTLCQKFRANNHLAPKVFDFRFYLEADRMLLLDSDVLFFDEPTELLNRIEDPHYNKNSVNADIQSAYTVDPGVVLEHCNVSLVPNFNSGLGLIHKRSLNLEWVEEFLALPNIHGHFWRIEQTLYALCSSRFGVELLPNPYSVFVDRPRIDEPVRHYVGEIRHLMYSEGIRQLAQRVMSK